MRQKLAIARGLLSKSRLLFMDEPTKGLDPIASGELLELIGKEIIPRYGITVLMTTHILREAEILCDRVAIIEGGKIVACDTPSRLQSSFRDFEIYSLKLKEFDTGFIDRIRGVDGVLDITATNLPDDEVDLELHLQEGSEALSVILSLLAGAPSRILSCTRQKVSLDDSFSAIVRGERNGKGGE
jgi:ABC-2 type transport system ATP-binding protein